VTWTVLYTRRAARSIRKLDPQVQRRVRAAIDVLSQSPERGKPLQLTLRGLRSWRTGDFRIVYRVIDERIEILVIAIGHRRQVYDRLRDRVVLDNGVFVENGASLTIKVEPVLTCP
jgi:mRNA interferase RelE/StbE